MYTNSAYIHNSLLDIVDKSKPIIITSCGTYKLYTQKEFTTFRPKGRKDYQLIYVAAGKAHFEIDGKDMIACPGNMVIYRPRQILTSVHRQQGQDGSKNVSAMAEEMDRAAGYFGEHYNEEIVVEDYANEHNMSVSWFIRNFRQRIGTTPTQYIMAKRIANAQMLLESSDYNMTEIARIVGYDNPFYFSRVFKKEKGMSPMEYRKSIRR